VQVTEVRIKLMEEPGERLRAFCSITFDDCFVVRDLKIIEGTTGPFVAMPSRKLTAHCPQCGCKNHLRAAWCNQCGLRMKEDRTIIRDDEGRAKLYADIAHPINSACREMIQQRVLEEFHVEQERAKQPGYISRYDDYFDQEDMLAQAHARGAIRPEKRLRASVRRRRLRPARCPARNQPARSSPRNRSRGHHTKAPIAPPGPRPAPPPGGSFGAGIFE